ncbi:MAG: tRNA dihydrouridine synthase DusB [Nitrospiraceae bacterium]|nr:MAG: tRNA dihydrouridine synthase DusB [Nitrospiraceae bacterium]
MLSIGSLTVASPLVLAPLSGISDLPFRLINRSYGCGLAFTEMICARSLVHNSKNTLKRLLTTVDDRPLGVQILGDDPEILKRALDILSEYVFDIIDFNAACPAGKVVSDGKGAGLLKEPLKLQKLLKVIVERAGVPVTVKIRSGWDETSINAKEIALRAQETGVKGLFIHGRTRTQGYSGRVDYNIIRAVKDSLTIPVIASGDALTPDLIKKLFYDTGCDGVAVARGALGNPWIFRQAVGCLHNGTVPPGPDIYEIVRIMKAHLLSNIAFHGERTGVILFRKFFGWYARGMAIKELKGMAFGAVTRDEMLRLIDELPVLPANVMDQDSRGFEVVS